MNKHQTIKPFFTSIILTIGLFYSVNAYAQVGNPITDAPKLKIAIDKLIVNPDSPALAQAVLDLINTNSSDPFETYKEMRDFIQANKSVFGFIDSLLAKVKSSKLRTDSINLSPDAFISTRATFQASNPLGLPAIDALGTFIAERFKQELEIAFLQKFKDWLENDTAKASEALRLLLPETKSVLSQNEPYQYTVFLETLKESFRKDLNNIPVNIGAYLGTDPFKLGKKTPYYFTSLLIYNNIVQIVNGQPAIDVLRNLAQDSLLPKSDSTVQSVVQLLSISAQLLTNPDKPEEWLNVSKIRSNLNTVSHIKIFIELFLLKFGPQLTNITVSGSNLYQAFVSNKGRIESILDWIKILAENYMTVQTNFDRIRDIVNADRDIPGDAVLGLENSLIVTFKSFFKIRSFGIKIDPSLEMRFDSVVIKIRSFTELVINIKEKNYGLALTKAIDMLITFINNPKAIDLIRKYGNFAVSVAKAENKNDMLAALRTAALPVGSYRIKRNSFTNISLNAYAGLGVGYQKFSSDVPAGIEKTNTILGFTAPVGLAYSWGYRQSKNKDSLNQSSGTIFLSILDIGAVTAFRLTKDSTETLPELKWSNLLAPGAYYVHGFKRSPISVGFGIQYGPEVRSIKNNTAVELPAAWSVRLFLAVDIPVFNFYSRTELKEKRNRKK